jgi:hypothetical protein
MTGKDLVVKHIIYNQADWDDLPSSTKNPIEIHGGNIQISKQFRCPYFIIKAGSVFLGKDVCLIDFDVIGGFCFVESSNRTYVIASGKSTVRCHGNCHITAFDTSIILAYGKCIVDVYDRVSVYAGMYREDEVVVNVFNKNVNVNARNNTKVSIG